MYCKVWCRVRGGVLRGTHMHFTWSVHIKNRNKCAPYQPCGKWDVTHAAAGSHRALWSYIRRDLWEEMQMQQARKKVQELREPHLEPPLLLDVILPPRGMRGERPCSLLLKRDGGVGGRVGAVTAQPLSRTWSGFINSAWRGTPALCRWTTCCAAVDLKRGSEMWGDVWNAQGVIDKFVAWGGRGWVPQLPSHARAVQLLSY